MGRRRRPINIDLIMKDGKIYKDELSNRRLPNEKARNVFGLLVLGLMAAVPGMAADHDLVINNGRMMDQDSNFGAVFTKLAPAAKLSRTHAYSETCPAVNGAHDPFLTGWNEKVTTTGVPTHRPSGMVKGRIHGFLDGYGHEDIMLRKS